MEEILRLRKDSIPIVLIGLPYAGKTTLVNWLKEKRFTRPKTTVGMDIEKVKIGDLFFNIFDISGQEAFRETMWKSNVLTSIGVIFVLDSSDKTILEEAKNWFWKMVNEWLGGSYSDKTILFLANKSDLKKSMSIDRIIQYMKLDEMSSYQNISFQLFKTSIRTGSNIELALKWFTSKIKQSTSNKIQKFDSVIISDILGNLIFTYDPNEIAKDTSMFIGYVKALSGFANEIFGEERFKVLKIEERHFFISENKGYVVVLAMREEEFLPEARRLSYLIHEQINPNSKNLESEITSIIQDYLE